MIIICAYACMPHAKTHWTHRISPWSHPRNPFLALCSSLWQLLCLYQFHQLIPLLLLKAVLNSGHYYQVQGQVLMVLYFGWWEVVVEGYCPRNHSLKWYHCLHSHPRSRNLRPLHLDCFTHLLLLYSSAKSPLTFLHYPVPQQQAFWLAFDSVLTYHPYS